MPGQMDSVIDAEDTDAPAVLVVQHRTPTDAQDISEMAVNHGRNLMLLLLDAVMRAAQPVEVVMAAAEAFHLGDQSNSSVCIVNKNPVFTVLPTVLPLLDPCPPVLLLPQGTPAPPFGYPSTHFRYSHS